MIDVVDFSAGQIVNWPNNLVDSSPWEGLTNQANKLNCILTRPEFANQFGELLRPEFGEDSPDYSIVGAYFHVGTI